MKAKPSLRASWTRGFTPNRGWLAAIAVLIGAGTAAGADLRNAAKRVLPATVAVQWQSPEAEEPEPAKDGVGPQSSLDQKAVEQYRRMVETGYATESALKFVLKAADASPKPLYRIYRKPADKVSLSSGTIVSPDGLIVTWTGQTEEGEYSVTFDDGRTVPAQLLVEDRRSGLKLLEVDENGLPYVELAQTDDEAQPGQLVLAAFCRDPKTRTVAQGIVAGTGRSLRGFPCPLLQTDVRVGSMSAGGPLADVDGRLLGIIAAKTDESQEAQTTALAIPVDYVQMLMEARKGDEAVVVDRGYLGIVVRDPSEPGGPPLVGRVADDMPAAAAGLKEDDEILTVDGRKMLTTEDVVHQVGRHTPGEKATVTINRDGKELELEATLASRETQARKAATSSRKVEAVTIDARKPAPQQVLIVTEDGTLHVIGTDDGGLVFTKPEEGSSTPDPQELLRQHPKGTIWRQWPSAAVMPAPTTIRVQRSGVEKKLDQLDRAVESLREQTALIDLHELRPVGTSENSPPVHWWHRYKSCSPKGDPMGKALFTSFLILRMLASACSASDGDSDHDGLSDFQEIHKYRTNPKKQDSDGDGLPDGDWHERREYAYSVRSVVKVMRPCNLETINDDYQDARVLSETKDHVELEVIHYPFNTNAESIEGDPAWRARSAEMRQWIDPGVTTNWDARMRKDVLAELKEAGIDVETLTDKEIVERVAHWALRRGGSAHEVFTTFYVHFPEGRPAVYPGLEETFQREFDRDGANYDWAIDGHFDHELLGRGMFYNKTHGSCTSYAVYQTTLLRAAGIPARMILVIPIVDPSDPKQIQLIENHIAHPEVRETLLFSLKGKAGFINHTFNEVYIQERWRRLDYHTLGRNTYGPGAMGMVTHVHTFGDLSDADLTATWGVRYAKGLRDDVFAASNPYRTTELSDRIGIHSGMKIPKPRQIWEKTGNIRILSAYWWDDLPADDWRKRGFSPDQVAAKAGYLLLHVDSAIGTRLSNQDVIRLLSRVDRSLH
ncbi:MAG: PDZ domain-containing protein, partial [Planctomycetota bacterium]